MIHLKQLPLRDTESNKVAQYISQDFAKHTIERKLHHTSPLIQKVPTVVFVRGRRRSPHAPSKSDLPSSRLISNLGYAIGIITQTLRRESLMLKDYRS